MHTIIPHKYSYTYNYWHANISKLKMGVNNIAGYHRFQFYATIGGFSSGENCVSAVVNHTIYGASTKPLLSVLQICNGFCVFKISVIVHNSYCVKCSLSYTALYWYLPEKSCHLLADSSINNSWLRVNWLIIRRYFVLLVSVPFLYCGAKVVKETNSSKHFKL